MEVGSELYLPAGINLDDMTSSIKLYGKDNTNDEYEIFFNVCDWLVCIYAIKRGGKLYHRICTGRYRSVRKAYWPILWQYFFVFISQGRKHRTCRRFDPGSFSMTG